MLIQTRQRRQAHNIKIKERQGNIWSMTPPRLAWESKVNQLPQELQVGRGPFPIPTRCTGIHPPQRQLAWCPWLVEWWAEIWEKEWYTGRRIRNDKCKDELKTKTNYHDVIWKKTGITTYHDIDGNRCGYPEMVACGGAWTLKVRSGLGIRLELRFLILCS